MGEQVFINLCMECMNEKKTEGPCPHCGFDPAAYEVQPYHLHPGTILNGKYLVGKVMGEGGFGITYVGFDLNLEMKIAVKEYFPFGMVTRSYKDEKNTITAFSGERAEYFQKGREKFVDEAKRMARLHDLPGIIFVKDFFRENGTAYIIMEFVEGKTLAALLQEQGGSMKPDTVFSLMKTAMETLEKIHAAGLIHRDISPDNIMIDQRGNLKLLDFGAAREYSLMDTRSLSVMMKPGYTPVEQYHHNKSKQGPYTDVYALCATMYRAITGTKPPDALERSSSGSRIKRPSEMGISIPSYQEDALMKGLEYKAEDRFQTMRELENALFMPHSEPEPQNMQNQEQELKEEPWEEQQKIEEQRGREELKQREELQQKEEQNQREELQQRFFRSADMR